MELLLHDDDLIERNGRKIAKFYPGVQGVQRLRIVESIGCADDLADTQADLERSNQDNVDLNDEIVDLEKERDTAIEERDDLKIEVEALNEREHVYLEVIRSAGLMPKVEAMLEATEADLVDELTMLRKQCATLSEDLARMDEENQSLLEELNAARKTIRTHQELSDGLILSASGPMQEVLGILAETGADAVRRSAELAA